MIYILNGISANSFKDMSSLKIEDVSRENVVDLISREDFKCVMSRKRLATAVSNILNISVEINTEKVYPEIGDIIIVPSIDKDDGDKIVKPYSKKVSFRKIEVLG